jgi:hypothetical protein
MKSTLENENDIDASVTYVDSCQMLQMTFHHMSMSVFKLKRINAQWLYC